MTDLVFGYTWEQIQNAQQGREFRHYIPVGTTKPLATEADVKLLVEKGLTWLVEQQFHGVIDRLKNSGLIVSYRKD
jgi:hypothetical protein